MIRSLWIITPRQIPRAAIVRPGVGVAACGRHAGVPHRLLNEMRRSAVGCLPLLPGPSEFSDGVSSSETVISSGSENLKPAGRGRKASNNVTGFHGQLCRLSGRRMASILLRPGAWSRPAKKPCSLALSRADRDRCVGVLFFALRDPGGQNRSFGERRAAIAGPGPGLDDHDSTMLALR